MAVSTSSPRTFMIPADQVDTLVRLTEDLQDFIANHPAARELTDWRTRLEKAVWDLQLTSLLPMTLHFQEMVQELAARESCSVQTEFQGFSLSVGHSLAEVLSLILVHGIRNAISHGIESPAERKVAGKSSPARIEVTLRYTNGKLVGTLQDDGRGPALSQVLKKAVTLGLVPAGQSPTEAELFALLFAPRLSTTPQLGELSGLGMGLDAIQTAVQSEGGSLRAFRPTSSSTGKPGEGFVLEFTLPMRVLGLEVVSVTTANGLFYVSTVEAERLKLHLPQIQLSNPEYRAFRILDPIWSQTGPEWLRRWWRDPEEVLLAARVPALLEESATSFELGILTDSETLLSRQRA